MQSSAAENLGAFSSHERAKETFPFPVDKQEEVHSKVEEDLREDQYNVNFVDRKTVLQAKLDTQKEQLIEQHTQGLSTEEKEYFEQAYIDPATGLFNQNGVNLLHKTLRDETQDSVSIAMSDGNHYGALNDHSGTDNFSGRDFGDFGIQIMAKQYFAIMEKYKEYNLNVLRKGGEEFIVYANCSKEQLAEIMREVTDNIQKEIVRNLNPENIEAIARAICEKTSKDYTQADIEEAKQYIGGGTSGIVETAANSNYSLEDTNNAIELADANLIKGKDEHGRGDAYILERDLEATQERIFDFATHNNLSESQNIRSKQRYRRLQISKIRKLIYSRPMFVELRQSLSSENQMKLFDFITTPEFKVDDISTFAKNFPLSAEKVREVKSEYLLALKEVNIRGMGAPTMHHLLNIVDNNENFNRENIKICSFGAFKSLNEVMGHGGGDGFLEDAYRQVFGNAQKLFRESTGINLHGYLHTAQKGPNVAYVLNNNLQGHEKAFQEKLQQAFKEFVHWFNNYIGAVQNHEAHQEKHRNDNSLVLEEGQTLNDIRTIWAELNAKQDLNFKKRMFELEFEDFK